MISPWVNLVINLMLVISTFIMGAFSPSTARAAGILVFLALLPAAIMWGTAHYLGQMRNVTYSFTGPVLLSQQPPELDTRYSTPCKRNVSVGWDMEREMARLRASRCYERT